jgi:hypothetical protein
MDELILRCKTKTVAGVSIVKRHFNINDKEVNVRVVGGSGRSACPAQLSLQLQGIALTELPSELFHMNNIEQLKLNDNNLGSLPSEIALLTKLEGLFVSHNQLTALPPELGLLGKLKRLFVSHTAVIDGLFDLTPITSA